MGASGKDGEAGTMTRKRILISGGTGGVGFAVARRMAGCGASLVISGRSEAAGDKAVDELRRLGAAHAAYIPANAYEPADAQRLALSAVEVLGGIDTMISAGGSANPVGLKPFASHTAEELIAVLHSQILPRILPVHAAIPYLRQAGGGGIVMLGTDAGRHATPGESMVGAGGAQIIMLTKVLARELARDRIRVNSVALTITSGTPGWERMMGQEFSAKVFAKALERFPFGRAPNVDEVARAVVFLARDESAQITGQTISVNGGLSFGGW